MCYTLVMEKRTLKELYHNNKLIKLNKEITFYSDGSYTRNDGVRRYGNSNGNYLKMSLYDTEGKEHKVFMHTLILCIFISDRPSAEYEVDHIDRNKRNNNVNNLRWVTRRINIENKAERKGLNCSLFIKLFNESENKFNLSYDTVHHRVYNLGWSFEKAMMTPVIARSAKTKAREEGYNKRKTELRRWFDKQESKVSFRTFRARVKLYGWSKEDALK